MKHTYEFTNILLEKGLLPKKAGADIYEFQYSISNSNYKFKLKKNSSDSRVFEQIILNEEYKTVVDEIRKRKIKVESILDLGANIGLSSIYLSAHLSPSKIIALEPSKSTFDRLERNLESTANVKCIQKGVWSRNAFLKADTNFRDGEDWSFRLVETSVKEEAIIEAVGLDDLMNSEQISQIDLLKIDVEGGEVELFKSNHLPWLQKTKIIALEIHDEFECRIEIERKLVEYGFDIFHSGELTIGFNNSFDK